MAAQIVDLSARTVSIPEAGKILGIGTSKAYALAKSGDFPIRVLKLGKQLRVSISQLDAYLDGRLQDA